MKVQRKKLIVLAVFVTVLVAAAASIVWRVYTGTKYDGEEPCWVFIPKGCDADSVSAILARDLGDSGRRAATLWRHYGSSPSVAHGAYRIEPGTRSIDIFKRIARGAQTPVKLTFNNVRLLPQFAGRIAARLEADSASIISAIDSVLSAQGYKPAEYIGAFFPDTYEFLLDGPGRWCCICACEVA